MPVWMGHGEAFTFSSPPPSPRPLILGLVLAVSLHAFEQVAIVAILDDVVRALHGVHLSGLLFGTYLTATMLAMVITGERLDRGLYARSLMMGLFFFAAGLLVAAAARDIYMLLGARALQGFGGGVVQTVAFGAVNRAFPEQRRARVLAYLSQAWVIPGIIGPVLAGALAEYLHWRSVFIVVLVFVPVVPLFAFSALRALDDSSGPLSGVSDPSRIPAALSFAGALAVALVGLSMSHALWVDLILAAAGLTGAGLFLARLLPPGVLCLSFGLPAAIGVLFIVFFAFFGVDSFLPMALKQLRGQGTLESALVLTPAAVLWAMASLAMARVTKRQVPVIRLGFLFLAMGVAGSMGIVWLQWPAWIAFPAWGAGGFGIGIVHLGGTAIAMAHTPPGQEGATAAGISLVTSLGFAISTAVVGALIALGNRLSASPEGPFVLGWMFGLAACVLGLFSAGRLNARPLQQGVSAAP